MIEIFTQIRNKCPFCESQIGVFFLPNTEDDRDKAREYKLFQIVKTTIQGFRKQRSLKQLNTYWKACEFIADSAENKQWGTKYKVDFQCRVEAHFVDPSLVVVRPDGSIQFAYRSIAVKNLPHIEACNYFDQAFGVMVDFWNATHHDKITQDELIEMVKESMNAA